MCIFYVYFIGCFVCYVIFIRSDFYLRDWIHIEYTRCNVVLLRSLLTSMLMFCFSVDCWLLQLIFLIFSWYILCVLYVLHT
jgi:hypothetical protein